MGEWLGAPWASMGWVAASTAATYATAVLCVRLAGRRTLAELSAFDTVVTVALGSVVATTAVQKSASYAQGATAIGTLLVLQTAVAAVRQRYPAVRRFLDFGPQVVVRHGSFVPARSPLSAQLTVDDVRSQLRQRGVFSMDDVTIVIVEPSGKISLSRDEVDDAALDRIERD